MSGPYANRRYARAWLSAKPLGAQADLAVTANMTHARMSVGLCPDRHLEDADRRADRWTATVPKET